MTWPFGDLPRAHFKTLALDPPWKFSAGTKGRPQHYERMGDEEISVLPLTGLCHPEGAHVFVWTTSPIAERFWRVIAPAWRKQGLRYSGRAFVWVKLNASESAGGGGLFITKESLFTGQGFTTRKNAEDCLLFKVGKPQRLARDVREVIMAPRREHSRKPDEFFDRAEKYSEGPYLELFSRASRPGWSHWGNETGRFDGEAA